MKRLTKVASVIAAAALNLIAQSSINITTTTLPPAIIGQTYPNVTLQTTGSSAPISWSIDGPSNWTVGSVNATTGVFCYKACGGFAVQEPPGQYPLTIVANSDTGSGSRNYTLVVQSPLQIVTTSVPNANANLAYSTQLQAIGGTGNYRWSIQSGTLPPGIALTDNVKGILSGTAPGVNGTYPFTVRLLDQATNETVSQQLSISVVNGIAILTTALPDAVLRQVYSVQLQGTGANLVWSLVPGSVLPPNLTLNPSGLLSGIVLGPGSYSVPVQLVNAQFPNAVATQTFNLLVTLGPLNILEQTLSAATQNVPYSTTLTPAGGIPPYIWSLDISTPKALSIGASTGTISGTLTTAGLFPVTVALRDSAGATVSRTYSLAVGNAVSITTTSLANGSPNAPYSAALTAAGGVLTYSWSITSGSLPPGLTLDAANGKITGTPTVAGTSQFTVQVKDFVGGIATKALSITIGPFLSITTVSLPGGALTQPYSQTVTAINGTAPLTWSIASGALPAGLQLNSATGLISGTPTQAGNSTFDILVTDTTNATARKTLSINIANNPLVITSNGFSGDVLVAFSQTLAATGGTPPYTWSVPPNTLPAGLQLNGSTGVISGTPGAGGVFPVLFSATDVNGLAGTKTIPITINLPSTPATSVTVGTTTQPVVGLTTGAPYPLEITGVINLTFVSSAGGSGSEARFSDGTRTVQYIVRANQTQAIFPTVTTPAVITGTVAGTITLTATMSAGGQDITPSPAPAKTITVDSAVPVITSVTLTQVTGGLNVVVTGYSNTREVSSGSFTFAVSSGNSLSQATLTVPLTSAFAAWFSNSASNATGGQFKLTVPFSVTQGAAAAVTKVTVTLTNTKGASAAVTSP